MKTAEIGSKEQRGLRTNTVYELNYNNYGQQCPSPGIDWKFVSRSLIFY